MSDWLQDLEDDAQYDPELYDDYDEYYDEECEDPEFEEERAREAKASWPVTTLTANGYDTTRIGGFIGCYAGLSPQTDEPPQAAVRALAADPARCTVLHKEGDEERGHLTRVTPAEIDRFGLWEDSVAIVAWEDLRDPDCPTYVLRHLNAEDLAELENAFGIEPGREPPGGRKPVQPGRDTQVAAAPARPAAGGASRAREPLEPGHPR